jgi:hypothetical protein
VNIDSKQGTVRVVGDIDPTILTEMFEKMGKPAELLSFHKVPSQRRTSNSAIAVTTTEEKLGLHVTMIFLVIIIIMIMSMIPEGAVSVPIPLRWRVAEGLDGEVVLLLLTVQGSQEYFPIRCIVLVPLL